MVDGPHSVRRAARHPLRPCGLCTPSPALRDTGLQPSVAVPGQPAAVTMQGAGRLEMGACDLDRTWSPRLAPLRKAPSCPRSPRLALQPLSTPRLPQAVVAGAAAPRAGGAVWAPAAATARAGRRRPQAPLAPFRPTSQRAPPPCPPPDDASLSDSLSDQATPRRDRDGGWWLPFVHPIGAAAGAPTTTALAAGAPATTALASNARLNVPSHLRRASIVTGGFRFLRDEALAEAREKAARDGSGGEGRRGSQASEEDDGSCTREFHDDMRLLRAIFDELDSEREHSPGIIGIEELWQFLQQAPETWDEARFAQMEREMSRVDADSNGCIDFREFVALMCGRFEGTEWLTGAMRAAFAMGSTGRHRSAAGRVSSASSASSASDDETRRGGASEDESERAMDPVACEALRAIAGRPMLPAGAQIEVAVITGAPPVRLAASGAARGDADGELGEALRSCASAGGCQLFRLCEGETLVIGASPAAVDQTLRQLGSWPSFRQHCRAADAQACFVGAVRRDAPTADQSHLLLRLEPGGKLRLLGLMNRRRCVHLWRPTDLALEELRQLGERPPPPRSADGAEMREDRVTAPLAPLYFSERMDCSLVLRFEHMMRGSRDFFLVHLGDGDEAAPVHVLIGMRLPEPSADFLSAEARRRSLIGRRRTSEVTKLAPFPTLPHAEQALAASALGPWSDAPDRA